MSTSTPGSTLGDCVVCGTRTATRCSECASNGTKWMFFCSREHQKLIYKTHKRVCGKLSSPLRWPELTEKEAQKVRDSKSLTRKCYEGKTFGEVVPTWYEGKSLDSLIRIAQLPYGLGQGIDSHKFSLVAVLRAECIAVRVKLYKEGDAKGEAEEMLQDTFGFMIRHVIGCWEELVSKEPLDDQTWWDPLMHRLLILYHLIARSTIDMASGSRPDMLYVRHALQEVIHILQHDVTKTNPEEAQRLITHLIETFARPLSQEALRTEITLAS